MSPRQVQGGSPGGVRGQSSLSKADRAFMLSVANMTVGIERDASMIKDRVSRRSLLNSVRFTIGDISSSQLRRFEDRSLIQERKIKALVDLSTAARDAIAGFVATRSFVDFVEIVDDALIRANSALEEHRVEVDRDSWKLVKMRNIEYNISVEYIG